MFKCGKHVIRDPVSYLAQMIAPQTPATTPPRTTADKGMDEGGRAEGVAPAQLPISRFLGGNGKVGGRVSI